MEILKRLLLCEVPRGWKPGAISKHLLRILKKAKQNQRPVEEIKLVRKQKKLVEDKATLAVSKKDGEYRIEMQVASELGNIEPSPLVYRITREDNVDRIKKRERQTRRFIRDAAREVWLDPYHPDVCEDTCLKAYKQAIGITQNVNDSEYTSPEKKAVNALDSCSCDDEEISTECSSLDNDWEIRFSPPIAKVS